MVVLAPKVINLHAMQTSSVTYLSNCINPSIWESEVNVEFGDTSSLCVCVCMCAL